MTVELVRLDDRLVHGQVVVGWGQALAISLVVLVDDKVRESEWEQELYRMGTPPEMEVYFNSVSAATEAMSKYATDARHGILLTGTITAMLSLTRNAGVRQVNIGGIHHRSDRKQKLRYVFLSPEEEQELRQMASEGVSVTAQDVPATRPVELTELLESEASVQ